MVLSVSVFTLVICAAYWEVQLAAAAQHQERMVLRIDSLGKDQNSVSTECVSLLHHLEVEKL